jgi:hypothetical protein
MKRTIEEWTTLNIFKNRDTIQFPVYQRETNLWTTTNKERFIDSIMIGLDVPKIYLFKNNNDTYDCIDGRQRIETIWGFFNNDIKYAGRRWDSLTPEEKDRFEKYKITIAMIIEATEDELRKLFIRLQLGLPLNAGERLHAMKGQMHDIIFQLGNKDTGHPFFRNLGIPGRRFAKEQVCAQIFKNSINMVLEGQYSDSRYDDLRIFLERYEHLDKYEKESKTAEQIRHNLDILYSNLGGRTKDIRNRAMAVSVYLFVEEMINKGQEDKIPIFTEFFDIFNKRLKEETLAGFYAKNENLYKFEKFIIEGAGSRSQVTNRHIRMLDFFEYYLKNKTIKGDALT